ncbi:MAG: hypothetical protein Kow00123_00770 [Anaerolineales bacterium]
MTATRHAWAVLLVLVTVLALTATALAAGPYELLWYAVGAGGVQCEGGPYALSASISQAAGEPMSGGAYSLSGGFWSGVPPVYLWYLPVIFR